MQEIRVRSLGWEDPLEKEMAIHSSTIASKFPRTEEPGRLQSMGSQSWTWLIDFTFTFTFFFIHSQHRDFCMLCSFSIVVAWTGSRRTLLLVSTWGYCARLLLLRMVLSKWLFFIQMSVLGQFLRQHTQLRAGGLLGVLSATAELRRGWGWTVLQIQ